MNLKALVRPAVHAARVLRDRTLHGGRRDRARRELGACAIRKVLVLCHGNVCRSPFAEQVIRAEFERVGRGGVVVQSAGFIGPERQPPENALAVGREFNVEMSDHRSRLVTPQALQSASVIVVMSSDQARQARWNGARAPIIVLGDLDPQPVVARTIRDPWNCEPGVFRDSYARIVRCAREFVAAAGTPPR